MSSIVRSALVSHSAAEMYELVRDIESYPQFLPWCDSTNMIEQSDTHQLASITIDKRMKGISFTTRNTLVTNESLEMALVDGPFKQLSGIWRFKPLDEAACRVELSMDFEFQSRLLGVVMGPAFSKICDTMVAAFVKRAAMVFDPATVALGVFGQTENDEYELQAGDRIEIYRPLEQDPKEWRRQRAQVDKSRTNNK